jgi:site-specific DNA-methyltransferase (adenine-specific)
VTEPGDVVWEPFGGLCSGSVAAVTLGRRAFAAETDPAFADLAAERLRRPAVAPDVPAVAMVAR